MTMKQTSWIKLIFLVAAVAVLKAAGQTTDNSNETGATSHTTTTSTAITTSTKTTAAGSTTNSAVSSQLWSSDPGHNSSNSSNCTCGQRFRDIYQKKPLNQNQTTASPSTSNETKAEHCPENIMDDLNNSSCVKLIPKNCSVIVSTFTTDNKNLSFGLVCFRNELRIVSWTVDASCSSLELINNSNAIFCGMEPGLNCSWSSTGVRRLDKRSIFDPFILGNNCSTKIGTTPIPLLPNPVGPEAVTAIVVLVCLAITAILAGFFFWPKCHNPNTAPKTPKKKGPPPAEAFNVVAFSSASPDTVAVVIPPGQVPLGPAAA